MIKKDTDCPFKSSQVSCVYVASKHLKCKLSLDAYYIKQVLITLYKTCCNNCQQFPHEQALGYSGEKKLPFNRQKPPTDPGSEVGGHLPQPAIFWYF